MADDLGSTESRPSAIIPYPTANNLQLSTDECSDKYKVMASQAKYLSVSKEIGGEMPVGVLFYKESRIMVPVSICVSLINDAHGTRHSGITKTYNTLHALYWWPGLFSLIIRVINGCQTCQMS